MAEEFIKCGALIARFREGFWEKGKEKGYGQANGI